MELTGKIIQLLEEKSGESAKGSWRKQEYILETGDQYPKKVCFMAWSDKIDEFAINEGETVTVSIDLESREYNGRWYTDVKAWKVSRGNSDAYAQSPEAPSSEMPQTFGDDNLSDFTGDKVPF